MSLLGSLVSLKEQTHKVQLIAVSESSVTAEQLSQVEQTLSVLISIITRQVVNDERSNKQDHIAG